MDTAQLGHLVVLAVCLGLAGEQHAQRPGGTKARQVGGPGPKARLERRRQRDQCELGGGGGQNLRRLGCRTERSSSSPVPGGQAGGRRFHPSPITTTTTTGTRPRRPGRATSSSVSPDCSDRRRGELANVSRPRFVTGLACQRFARNRATPNLTMPHAQPLNSARNLRGYMGT